MVSYKQIQKDLEDLSNLVEKSELWVYKSRPVGSEDVEVDVKKRSQSKEEEEQRGKE